MSSYSRETDRTHNDIEASVYEAVAEWIGVKMEDIRAELKINWHDQALNAQESLCDNLIREFTIKARRRREQGDGQAASQTGA